MTYSFLWSSRRSLVFIAVAAAAIAAGGCSTNTGSGASPLSHSTAIKPAMQSWKWVTVNDTSGTSTEVTGINNSTGSMGPDIVGNVFSSGSSSSAVSNSFTSIVPNTGSPSTFTDVSYPRTKRGSTGTQMNAIAPQGVTSEFVLAGWVSQPGDAGSGDVYAVINNQGLWSLLPPQGPGAGGQGGNNGYLFGINDHQVAVGYYTKVLSTSTTATTPPKAYEAAPPAPGPQYTDVPFPPTTWIVTQSAAYGINDNGDMVGTATGTINGHVSPVAWYALCLGSQQPCGPNSSYTSYCWQTLSSVDFGPNTSAYAAYAININDQVVGSYRDSNGGTHGFLATVSTPKSGSQCDTKAVQFPINAFTTDNNTVVHGINDAGYIVGWYSQGSKATGGFVGKPRPAGMSKRQRLHR